MDDPLRKRFVDDVMGGDDKDKNEGTVEDLIQWLRTLKFFEKTSVQESDVRDAYEELAKSNKLGALTYQEFLAILGEIAKKNNMEIENLKEQLMKVSKESDKNDKHFKGKLKQGKAKIMEILDSLENDPKVLKLRDQLKISKEDFHKCLVALKRKASSPNTPEGLIKKKDDFQKYLLSIAATNLSKVEIKKIIKKLEDMVMSSLPILPITDSDEDSDEDASKSARTRK